MRMDTARTNTPAGYPVRRSATSAWPLCRSKEGVYLPPQGKEMVTMGDYGWSIDFDTSQGIVAVEYGRVLEYPKRTEHSPTRAQPGSQEAQKEK